MMREYIEQIQQKENLSHDEITIVMEMIMSGHASMEDIKDFLLELSSRHPVYQYPLPQDQLVDSLKPLVL